MGIENIEPGFRFTTGSDFEIVRPPAADHITKKTLLIKRGAEGTVIGHSTDLHQVAVRFDSGENAIFRESGNLFESCQIEPAICPECEDKLSLIMDSPLVWRCGQCNSHYAIMKGRFSVCPDRGKLEDWPEMSAVLEGTVNDFLAGEVGGY